MWTFPKAAVAEAFQLGVETLGIYSYVWDEGPLPQWGQQAADKVGCRWLLDTAVGPRPLHFTVFLMPFCREPVTCIKRGSQSCDWHHTREIALSLSAGLGSSRGLALYSWWVIVPAHHGQCGLGLSDMVLPPWHRGILGNLVSACQGTWQEAAAGTDISAEVQSRKELLEQLKEGQSESLHLLY